MTIKNQIGKSIQLWRKQRKMTQEDFADLVGISVHGISSIERGVNSPALKTIEKISKVLNVPISEFYRSELDKKDNVKKHELISAILGILHKLNDDELEIILKQVGAFDSK
jgi:transcriptional regulator with XRE-family HTH domain